ncbi:MAG: acetyltransferase [Actinomycetota bacterium]
MSRVVVFGVGKTADVVDHQLTVDSPHEVVAFAVDAAHHHGGDRHRDRPVVVADDLEATFPPGEVQLFVAIGYQQLNRARSERMEQLAGRGYEFATYVCSAIDRSALSVGANCFVMGPDAVQPGAELGDDVFVWGGAVVAHHCVVGDHTWVASGAVIAGGTSLGERCFVGANATVGHELTLGARTFVGAGALVTSSLADGSVVVSEPSNTLGVDSERFWRVSGLG